MSTVARQELLAAATPRPWREGTSSGAVVADAVAPGVQPFPRDDADSIAYYGGVIVGESIVNADRELILRAVNEHEALLACEASLRAVVSFLGGQYGRHGRDALEKLEEIRRIA